MSTLQGLKSILTSNLIKNDNAARTSEYDMLQSAYNGEYVKFM